MADENARTVALTSMAKVAASSMAAMGRDTHGSLARGSHLAALTAERLIEATQKPGGIDQATLEGVLLNLREIQNEGHLAYVRQMGSEADYQQIGVKLRSKLQTPGGKWRK